MSRPTAILAAGMFVVFMGLRSLSGYETEIEHLYAGETVTVTCKDGKPYEGDGLNMPAARQKCAEARKKQRGSVPFYFGVGTALVSWGAFDLQKARNS